MSVPSPRLRWPPPSPKCATATRCNSHARERVVVGIARWVRSRSVQKRGEGFDVELGFEGDGISVWSENRTSLLMVVEEVSGKFCFSTSHWIGWGNGRSCWCVMVLVSMMRWEWWQGLCFPPKPYTKTTLICFTNLPLPFTLKWKVIE